MLIQNVELPFDFSRGRFSFPARGRYIISALSSPHSGLRRCVGRDRHLGLTVGLSYRAKCKDTALISLNMRINELERQ
jgi:hypothetical protein